MTGFSWSTLIYCKIREHLFKFYYAFHAKKQSLPFTYEIGYNSGGFTSTPLYRLDPFRKATSETGIETPCCLTGLHGTTM